MGTSSYVTPSNKRQIYGENFKLNYDYTSPRMKYEGFKDTNVDDRQHKQYPKSRTNQL